MKSNADDKLSNSNRYDILKEDSDEKHSEIDSVKEDSDIENSDLSSDDSSKDNSSST